MTHKLAKYGLCQIVVSSRGENKEEEHRDRSGEGVWERHGLNRAVGEDLCDGVNSGASSEGAGGWVTSEGAGGWVT